MKRIVLIIAILCGMTLGAFAQFDNRDGGVTYAPIVLPLHAQLGDQEAFLSTTTQAVSLSMGWNWFVPTVGMTLADLEAAIGDNGISINTQTENVTYEDEEWLGDDIALIPGHMYKIRVSANCSFTLTGTPASGVSFVVVKGYNWFGYTGSTETSIETILTNSSFTPVEGDAIITNSPTYQNTTFEEGEWLGDFETLVPGQGYIYISKDTAQKPLSF